MRWCNDITNFQARSVAMCINNLMSSRFANLAKGTRLVFLAIC